MSSASKEANESGADPSETSPLLVAENTSLLLGENETSPLLAVRDEETKNFGSHKQSELDLLAPELVPFPFNQIKCLDMLAQTFGWKMLVMLVAAQHMVRGFALELTTSATPFLLGSYGVTGPRMQVLTGVLHMPWALKPVIGFMSDCFPLHGYNKMPYIVLTSFLGISACVALGMTPHERLDLEHAVLYLALIHVNVSTVDLLSEAKYAEKMHAAPEHGPNLLTFVWSGVQGGSLLALLLSGAVMSSCGPGMPLLLASVPTAFVIFPTLKNYLQEVPHSGGPHTMRRRIMEQPEICFLTVVMFVGTLVVFATGIFLQNVYLNFFVSTTVACIMLVAFSVLLHPLIAKINAFCLIQASLRIPISGASFYFYTDLAEQFPEGPHFSVLFFTSVLGVISTLFSIFGIIIYQRYMQDSTYHRLFLIGNLAYSALSLFDCFQFSRLNIRMGIGDHVFVVGSQSFQSIIHQWLWMPGVVLMAQLCPRGMEATMYALLAGCHNLGHTVSTSGGSLLLKFLGCSPAGSANESAQFDKLWIASCISSLMPLFTLLLMPWLIPAARQKDTLLGDDDRDATSGSLWRHWTGR